MSEQAAFTWVYIFLQSLCLHRSEKHRSLLRYPNHIAIFTSYSSSAFWAGCQLTISFSPAVNMTDKHGKKEQINQYFKGLPSQSR